MVEGSENKTKAWWTIAELQALVKAVRVTVSADCKGLADRGVLMEREGRVKTPQCPWRYGQKIVLYKLCTQDKVAEESVVKAVGRPRIVESSHAK